MTETRQKLTFRCTDHEMKLIEDAASRAGKPKSHFVLDAGLSVINGDGPLFESAAERAAEILEGTQG